MNLLLSAGQLRGRVRNTILGFTSTTGTGVILGFLNYAHLFRAFLASVRASTFTVKVNVASSLQKLHRAQHRFVILSSFIFQSVWSHWSRPCMDILTRECPSLGVSVSLEMCGCELLASLWWLYSVWILQWCRWSRKEGSCYHEVATFTTKSEHKKAQWLMTAKILLYFLKQFFSNILAS